MSGGHDSHDSHGSGSHAPKGSGNSQEVAVFVGVLAVVGVLVFLALSVQLSAQLVAALVLVLIAVGAVHPKITEFKEYERGVYFRLGKFLKVVGPGWVLSFNTIDKIVKVDLRTQVLDIKPQEVITQDNVKITVDAVVYHKIVDAAKSIVEVKDYHVAVTNLIHAQIRTVVGRLLLEEVLEKTEEINIQLFKVIQDVEERWGIQTVRVEITSITLPPGLVAAFQKRREALEFKQKLETEASAKQVAIEILDRGLSGISKNTVAFLYLDVLKRVADGKSNKIIFPLELSRLANVVSEQAGWQKKDYEGIAKSLVDEYTKRQKDSLDSANEDKEEKK